MKKGYFKRLFKYVFYDFKQPIIHASICQKTPSEIFKDKVYLITGGTRGLGFYMAKKLIEEGAFVIITGRNENNMNNALSKLGEKAEGYIMDAINLESHYELIEKMFTKHGKINGLICNAGISLHESSILHVSEEGFDKQLDINLKGPYFLAKYYIDLCLKKDFKEGNVIFISSERGSMVDDLPYGLTKVSINSLCQALSNRFYRSGIRVNAIAPGVTATDLTSKDKNGDLYIDKAAGRVLVPEEIAEVLCFMLSDYSKCISGEIINCDAGNHINNYFKK